MLCFGLPAMTFTRFEITLNQKMSENESTKRSEMESLIHQAANRALVFSQNLIIDETTKLVEKGNKVHY